RYTTGTAEVAAIPGPHINRLSGSAQQRVFGQEYEVTQLSNRMGYRLSGQAIEIRGPEILSFGLTYGCVQMPWDGQPMLLMADHQTAGGYPVVACVIRADLPVVAQLLPGDKLRFHRTRTKA